MTSASPEVLRKRNTANVNDETVTNVASTKVPGRYFKEEHSWDLEEFRNHFRVEFHKNAPNDAVFSLIGLDASVANAFRRILLSEIPTLAIETVFIFQNTSIIQDEVLAHRLGLIPLQGNKEGLRWLKWKRRATEDDQNGDFAADFNTVLMNLDVECTWKDKGIEKAKKGETDPFVLYDNAHVYAKDLVFQTSGQQDLHFSGDGVIAAVNPDILLAKLRPGQSISVEMHAVKGIGSDHAKFSPVATASYRLLPVIDIQKPILGADARKFARCFPKGVIELAPVTAADAKKKGSGYEGKKGELKAVVTNPIADTVSRECLRHEEFRDKVKLGRQKDHFIFSVESTGQWDSDELFIDSVKILREKCQRLKGDLAELRAYT